MKILFLLSFIIQMQSKPTERQVLLFYSDTGKELLQKQKKQFVSREEGMKERDIVVKSFNISSTKELVIKEWDVDPLKNFTFILVGRDGGEKFRSHQLVSCDKLFGLVDAMPMRKEEMRRGGK